MNQDSQYSDSSLYKQKNSTNGIIEVYQLQVTNETQIQQSDNIQPRKKNLKLDLTVNSLQQQQNSQISHMKDYIINEIQQCRFAKEENVFELIQVVCAFLNKVEFLIDYNIRIQFDENSSLKRQQDILLNELNSDNLRNLLNEHKQSGSNISSLGISTEFKEFLTTNLSDILPQDNSTNQLQLIINGNFQDVQN